MLMTADVNPSANQTARVLLVDDHVMFREQIAQLVQLGLKDKDIVSH